MNELSPYLLEVEGIEEAAEMEEKRVGSGSFGYVFKVPVKGVECIAKKLHSAFVSESVESSLEKKRFVSNFRNECIIMSKLRHPNIVQFVGVHCGLRGTDDLTLIMESVTSDLSSFLSKNRNVPLSVKLSILLDVSYGLVYLHEFSPPIVHRDLTVCNVLITEKFQAKIADLGVAKIVTLQQQRDKVHTPTPGKFYYMPPEVLKEKAECTPKLDIFSFGHLTIFTVLQDDPEVYTISPNPTRQKMGTVERERRRRSLDKVGNDHCLYSIITDCLYDRPDQRPTTQDLNERLITLAAQKSILLDNSLALVEGKTSTAASEELDELKSKIKKLEKEKSQARNEADALTTSRDALQRRLDRCNEERQRLVKDKISLVSTKTRLQEQLTHCKSLPKENDDLRADLEARKQEVASIKESLMQKGQVLSNQDSELTKLRAQEAKYKIQIDSLCSKIASNQHDFDETKFKLQSSLDENIAHREQIEEENSQLQRQLMYYTEQPPMPSTSQFQSQFQHQSPKQIRQSYPTFGEAPETSTKRSSIGSESLHSTSETELKHPPKMGNKPSWGSNSRRLHGRVASERINRKLEREEAVQKSKSLSRTQDVQNLKCHNCSKQFPSAKSQMYLLHIKHCKQNFHF